MSSQGLTHVTAALHYMRFKSKILTEPHHSCLQIRKCCCTFAAIKQSHLVCMAWTTGAPFLRLSLCCKYSSGNYYCSGNSLFMLRCDSWSRYGCFMVIYGCYACFMVILRLFHGHATVVGGKGLMPADG